MVCDIAARYVPRITSLVLTYLALALEYIVDVSLRRDRATGIQTVIHCIVYSHRTEV